MKVAHLDITEIPVLILYIFLILFIANAVKNSLYEKDDPLRPYFIPALLARMLGALVIGAIYDFYYGGAGDTFAYYDTTSKLYEALTQDPTIFGDVLYSIFISHKSPGVFSFTLLRAFNYFTMGFITLPFYVLGFGYYYVTALLLGTFSFVINWNLFRFFYTMTRANAFLLALGILFFPNQVLWTSGLLKDTYVFIGVAGMLLLTHKILQTPKRQTHKIVFYIFLIYVIINIIGILKGYVINSFLPFVFLWIALKSKKNFPPLIRQTLYPLFLIGLGISSYTIVQNISQGSKWSPDKVLQFAVEHRQDLLKDYWYKKDPSKRSDSRYDIGDFEPTPEGVLSKAPISIVTTLFRPYVWEVRNPLMVLSALEGLFVLLVTLYVFFKIGILNFFRIIISNDDIKFTLGYTLFFGFFVGLTSANFGNLVRYKTPAMPFYFISLSVLYYYGYLCFLQEQNSAVTSQVSTIKLLEQQKTVPENKNTL